VNLILHTIDISPRSTVYDPYCRTGDFLLAAAQKAKELTGISGVTNTGLPRKFAGLRLLIQTASLSQSISKGLILTNYHNEEKFDYVIANPPFGSLSNPIQTVHQSGRWSTLAQHSERTDVILFGHCMDHLKTDGQMAIIVPNVFLSGKGIFKEIRRRLVEEYLLEAVVTLPARIFTGTGVSAAILFINKRGNKNDFFLLDAARMGIKKGNTVCLDMTRIMELIEIGKKRNTTADERLRIVSRQEAIDHDYDLQFSTYGTEEAFFPDNLVPSSQLLQECKAIEQELEQVRIRLNELMTGKPQ
jgi:type I restriction enzyme M protein